jgi:decaprenylphospho-beta-D-ribofuranose 2-oxidase
LSTLGLNRLIDFDLESGWLTCEAGTTLADIVEIFLPRGWFLMVTPGTRFVTVGGAIAADAHGKNHHRVGSFGKHVESLELLLADGRIVNCSAVENAELFAATCGGMGLTGMILTARIRLQPIETAMIRQETLRARDLHEVMAQFEESHGWSYVVAWIDCFASGASRGRSLSTGVSIQRSRNCRRSSASRLSEYRGNERCVCRSIFPASALMV